MESPNKRLKQSPLSPEETGADFVSLSVEDDNAANRYGYGEENDFPEDSKQDIAAPRAPRAMYQQHHAWNARNDPRNGSDKPKSKQALPGYEPWVLVRTKYGRRFVHNEETKESFWRFPPDVVEGVREFDALQRQQKEKEANAKWAEEQLEQMRAEQAAKDTSGRGHDRETRRRRSESLQREDEAALMVELAAEGEKADEVVAMNVVRSVPPLQPKIVEDANDGYGSDSSYEVIEVTDSEFEGEDKETEPRPSEQQTEQAAAGVTHHDEGPVEFGEDDIAYQLAAMEEDFDDHDEVEEEGLQTREYYEEEVEEEAVVAFREMLDDHNISPFTTWEKLIEDESDNGILMDDRYTVLPNMRTRKAVWETWVKDAAARLKEERAKAGIQDPKVPYLAFLAEKASPKLYWPEFKRKYRKEVILNDRKLNEKDREKLYRDHINRLKLPERTRKADLITLLKSIPLMDLNKSSSLQIYPQQLVSHLHYISLPSSARDDIIASHISALPPPPEAAEAEDGELTSEQQAAAVKREVEQRKQDDALRSRAKQVDEEKRKAEKAERFAKRDLREEENELRRAMEVGKGGLKGQLGH